MIIFTAGNDNFADINDDGNKDRSQLPEVLNISNTPSTSHHEKNDQDNQPSENKFFIELPLTNSEQLIQFENIVSCDITFYREMVCIKNIKEI